MTDVRQWIEERQAAVRDPGQNWGGAYHWVDEIADGEWLVLPIANPYKLDDLLSESNYRTALRLLEEHDPENVQQGHLKSWATNLDLIEVRAYDDDGQPTPAAELAAELSESLQGYPILDEMDFSELEFETVMGALIEDAPTELDTEDYPTLAPFADQYGYVTLAPYGITEEYLADLAWHRQADAGEYPYWQNGGGIGPHSTDYDEIMRVAAATRVLEIEERLAHYRIIGSGQQIIGGLS